MVTELAMIIMAISMQLNVKAVNRIGVRGLAIVKPRNKLLLIGVSL